jgi:outer membrane translocation and assembly module TamA
LYPSIGAGYLTPFNLLRLDVARGLRNGRWTFSVDVSKEFWSVL